MSEEAETEQLTRHLLQEPYEVDGSLQRRGFWLEVSGEAAEKHVSKGERCSLGSHPSNDLVLDDRKVSRFHCEITSGPDGYRLRDLESRNGTFLEGIRVESAWLRDGNRIQVGQTTLRFRTSDDAYSVPVSQAESFGGLVGRSVAMREAFGLLERCAKRDVTVLIEGETGTGKEVTAAAIHRESGRTEGPFVVVDCSAIPENLIESELFGHERGAFTGAVASRAGAFEEANGGTIFLDEIGELPSDLQPKLLRALEDRTIRRVGGKRRQKIDVRVVAATNRNLRQEVNEGRFRPDLYYRVAVMRVLLPPLRARGGDIPVLVAHLLDALDATEEQVERFLKPDFLQRVASQRWPGNVRELRNYIERCLVLDEPAPFGPGLDGGELLAGSVDVDLPFQEARRRAIAAFERTYLKELVSRHETVADAAKAAGLHRVYVHRLLTRHRLRD